MTITEQLGKLQQILAQNDITTLFQPIVRLSERRIFGFEALSRGPSNSPLHSPLTLFAVARQSSRLSELELLCRQSACSRFSQLRLDGKLFLNISPDSLMAPGHKPGCTLALLEAAGIPPSEVVIELTEQTPTEDFGLLDNALRHYRDMGFSIALDDLGAGYSSLRLWSELRPDYVKIDRYFIEGIHQDRVKREFVESILSIANASRAQVIAEGIELEEELQVLIEMGVDLVQGYLFARPQELPNAEMVELMPMPERSLPTAADEGCDLRNLILEEPAIDENTPIGEVLTQFRLYPERRSLAVLDAAGRPLGMIHRHLLSDALINPFATDLLARKPISRLMSREFLVAEQDQPLQQLSRQLTSRSRQALQETFVITNGGRYVGLGRIMDVLRLITDLKIRQAQYANPLTLLPGNMLIQQRLSRLLESNKESVVCYIDIDHFKPFNDIYGYARGDQLLLALASCLNRLIRPGREFVGHIGGDDFMLVLESRDWRARLQQLFTEFANRCRPVYQAEHLEQGFFVARGRHGVPEYHPLLSLSAGVVLVREHRIPGLDAERLALLTSEAKSQAKRVNGDALYLVDTDELLIPSRPCQLEAQAC